MNVSASPARGMMSEDETMVDFYRGFGVFVYCSRLAGVVKVVNLRGYLYTSGHDGSIFDNDRVGVGSEYF